MGGERDGGHGLARAHAPKAPCCQIHTRFSEFLLIVRKQCAGKLGGISVIVNSARDHKFIWPQASSGFNWTSGKRLTLAVLGILPTLSGCATFSFAPPNVNTSQHVETAGNRICAFNPRVGERVNDPNDLLSTFRLIDNYSLAYRCAVSQASNGRQAFQIPSFLSALVGVAAGAFNGSRDLAVGAGIAASTSNSANGYWAPQEKAGVLDSAFDAVLCIRTEAVGIRFFESRDVPAAVAAGSEIEVPVEWRYHAMISAALFQVDRIVASRLRSQGKFDAAGLVAEIEALTKKIDDAEKAKNPGEATQTVTPPVPDDPPDDKKPAPPGIEDDDGDGPNRPVGNPVAGTQAQGNPVVKIGYYRIDLDLLQPKIQTCVVRAKL